MDKSRGFHFVNSMKIINDLVQKSEAWLSFRLKHLGASECAAVLGLSPYTTKLELFEEKTGRSFKTFQSNKNIEYGVAMENLIKEEYSRYSGMTGTTPTCESDELPYISASFDFYNAGNNAIAEFKASLYPKLANCLRKNSVEAVKEQYGHYYWQVCQQMFVSGAKSCDIVTLSKEGELLVVTIPRNEEDIAFMVKGLVNFWGSHIIPDIAPQPDTLILKTPEALSLATELSIVMSKRKSLAEQEKLLRARIIDMADDSDFEVGKLSFKRTKPRDKFDKQGLYDEFEISDEDVKRFTTKMEGIGFYRITRLGE